MTKTAYRKPLAELVKFDDSDIICASALGKDTWDQEAIDKETENEWEIRCDGIKQHVDKGF